jgi:hypothetical protein
MYVIRVTSWSNDTFFNNYHAHDGEPNMNDLACNPYVHRLCDNTT